MNVLFTLLFQLFSRQYNVNNNDRNKLFQHPECSTGSYGRDCEGTCSQHCAGDANLCNDVSGTCDQGCDAGYLMPLCEDKCPIRKYGQDCAKMCDSTCLNSECHHVTGECNDCPKGYTGVFCEQECPHATYGSRCNQTCSMNCLNQTCDSTDGECTECIDSWTGDFCHVEVGGIEEGGGGSGEGGVPVVVVVAVAVIAAVATITAVIVGILYWRRRNVYNAHKGIQIHNNHGDNASNTYVTDFDHYDRPSDLVGSNGLYERSLSSTGSGRHLDNTNKDNRRAAIGHGKNQKIDFSRQFSEASAPSQGLCYSFKRCGSTQRGQNKTFLLE
ncbi:multiple epidermal growth factor-like domains 10 [Plakobranchus ocellatus]|uniref:Multiple epidermal growth factor-like domains 10 n=1 Tax=Plakobranchus ocellatus TaxID=259542 RepID=A0AAV4CYM9_9GAST|nr:multiple epidermal growth factor-like domains 10 [Plakobranchus ocellatus]